MNAVERYKARNDGTLWAYADLEEMADDAIEELEKERDEWKNAAYEETRVVVHCKARIHELEERLKR
jgi:hypothetical protein